MSANVVQIGNAGRGRLRVSPLVKCGDHFLGVVTLARHARRTWRASIAPPPRQSSAAARPACPSARASATAKPLHLTRHAGARFGLGGRAAQQCVDDRGLPRVGNADDHRARDARMRLSVRRARDRLRQCAPTLCDCVRRRRSRRHPRRAKVRHPRASSSPAPPNRCGSSATTCVFAAATSRRAPDCGRCAPRARRRLRSPRRSARRYSRMRRSALTMWPGYHCTSCSSVIGQIPRRVRARRPNAGDGAADQRIVADRTEEARIFAVRRDCHPARRRPAAARRPRPKASVVGIAHVRFGQR